MCRNFAGAEIIAAARTVFARRGFDAGIMDEIAREAGVAKGTLYLYFRNKTEIYKAVLDHDMRALKESTIERLDAAKGLKNKIRAFVLARLERAEGQQGILPHHGFGFALADLHAQPISRLASGARVAACRGH